MEMKSCNKCKTSKSLDDFHRDKRSGDGRCSYCKECNNAKSRQNYRDNLDRVKAYEHRRSIENPNRNRINNYKSKYGLTLEQYDEMSAAQNGACWTCKKPEGQTATQRLAVDHCHETGKVRRLLCSNCNRALGLMYEDADSIRALADYIESFTSD